MRNTFDTWTIAWGGQMDGWSYRVRSIAREPFEVFRLGSPDAQISLSVEGWEEQRTTAMTDDQRGYRNLLVAVSAVTPSGSWEYVTPYLGGIEDLRYFASGFMGWVVDGFPRIPDLAPDDDHPDLWFEPVRDEGDGIELKVTPAFWPDEGLRSGEPGPVTVRATDDELSQSLRHLAASVELVEHLPVDEGYRRFDTLAFLALPPFAAGEPERVILGDAQGAVSLGLVPSSDLPADGEARLDLEATVIGPVVWKATFRSWVAARDIESLARWIEADCGSTPRAVAPTAVSLSLARRRVGDETQLVLQPLAGPSVDVAEGELQDATFLFTPDEIRTAVAWVRSAGIRFWRV